MKKGFDRNYWLLMIEGSIFTGGIITLSTGGVVALFINTMTGSNTLVGLAVTVQALFIVVGQLISAPYVNSIKKLPQFLFKLMGIQRTIPMLIAIPLFLGITGHSAVWIFMALFAFFWFSDGIITLPWGELCARAVKPELRGHMMGAQLTVGSLVALIIGLLVTWLLATPSLDDNYRFGFIFMLGSAVLVLTAIFMRLVKDPSPTTHPVKLDVKKFYMKIPSIIQKSKPLRQILIARIPSYIGYAAVSFIIVFGANELCLSESELSWLVYAGIIGGIIGGVILGEASRRYGNKMIITICNIGMIIIIIMSIAIALIPGIGYLWLFVICTISGMVVNNWLGFFNYILDIAPREDRSAYQLLGQLIGVPFSFTGLLMGAIVDSFGYIIMFIICGIFSVITVFLTLPLMSKDKVTDFIYKMDEVQ